MFCLFLIFCTDYHLKGTLGHGVPGPMSGPVMSCGNETTWRLRAGELERACAGGFQEEVVGRAKLEGWGLQGGW